MRQCRPKAARGLALALVAAACAAPAPEGMARSVEGTGGSDAPRATQPREGAASTPDVARDRGVRPGARVLLADSLHLVRGRRVGLITNHTGVVRTDEGPGLQSTIDLLHAREDVDLVALYGPEHSLRGDAGAGERVEDGGDPRTGVPVFSLYGETRRPTPRMLEGVDVLLFDIQDVGARYYTYVWTMALAMEAAGEEGIPFVVLDRPNPIGGVRVQGNVLDPAFSSFVGLHPVPMRHGMTPGELARLIAGEFGVEVDLRVVPARGWEGSMAFAETDLPWVPPSPNMPSVRSARHYPGTCLFEGTPLSVGRGTERPFQQVGAPWLDGRELVQRLNGYDLADVRFEAVRFTPEEPGDGKFGGVEVEGVRFVATGPGYDPTRAAVAALVEVRKLSGTEWEWRANHFDRLAGTDRLRRGIESGRTLEALTREWPAELERFRQRRASYLLYPR